MKETKFKQTEVGMIPSDWDVLPLYKVGSFSKGAGISRDESNSGSIPAVRYGEIYTKHNDYVRQFFSRISSSVASMATSLNYGDIMFSASGETKEDIGKAVAFLEKCEAYAGGDIIILSPRIPCNSMYLGYALNSSVVSKQKSMKGQGDAVVHITTDSLKHVKVCFPKENEQQRIAKALSDVDTLIANLEKLIAKKKNIKQGAMQQLLTGRKRLPAFVPKQTRENLKMTELGPIPSDWDVKLLGNVYRFKYGIFNNNPDNGGPYPVYGANGIIGGFTSYNAEDSVVIGHIGTAGTVIWAEGKHFVTYNGTIAEVKDKSENDSLFGYYQLIRLDIPSICNGSSQPFLAYDKLNVLKIVMPSSKEEQTAIANILSDMDSEIQTLETKLAKYRKLKTGMMQQLLTGKIRLM